MRNYMIILGLSLLASACGKQDAYITADPQPNCSVKQVTGGAEVTCPDGSSTTISNGTTGGQGIQGLPGTNATSVTVVQLCPGTTTYGHFIETALCVDNSLFAVFWNGQAFMTLIPPGAYYSTSNYVACNFTVGANCTVSH